MIIFPRGYSAVRQALRARGTKHSAIRKILDAKNYQTESWEYRDFPLLIIMFSLRLSRVRLPSVRASTGRIQVQPRYLATTAPPAEEAAPSPSEGEQHIINKLTTKFGPSRLAVQDVSGTRSLLLYSQRWNAMHIHS